MKKALVYIALYIVSIGIVASTIYLHPVARAPIPIVRTIIVFFATVLLTKYFVYMVLSPLYDVWARRRDTRRSNDIPGSKTRNV